MSPTFGFCVAPCSPNVTGCFGSYSPITPPSGSNIVVRIPQRFSVLLLKRTPFCPNTPSRFLDRPTRRTFHSGCQPSAVTRITQIGDAHHGFARLLSRTLSSSRIDEQC